MHTRNDPPLRGGLLATALLAVALVPTAALATGHFGTSLRSAALPRLIPIAEKKLIVKEPDKHKEVIVKEKKEVVVRPIRPWEKKPHFGQFVAGVTLGAIVTAAAIGVAPPPPAPRLCWFWVNPAKDKGYWDYC